MTTAITMRRTGGALIVAMLALFALGTAAMSVSPVQAAHNSAAGDAKGTTPGWLDGREVTFFYPTSFLCQEPPTSGADSRCELGAEPESRPRAGGEIPVLYVMTPLGFRPDDSTLQCPTVGSCINHPSTIDVSRVFGPGTENIATPDRPSRTAGASTAAASARGLQRPTVIPSPVDGASVLSAEPLRPKLRYRRTSSQEIARCDDSLGSWPPPGCSPSQLFRRSPPRAIPAS